MFKAILLERAGDGPATSRLAELSETDLPEGEVLVAVEYSTMNYKDGLCLSPTGGGLVRQWPHVAGIDFAGLVESSSDPRYQKGDRVVLTGWRVGEAFWGGFAQKARGRADFLVKLPESISTRRAMAVGTAGFTAMMAVMALEEHGLAPDQGEVLVTGAAGGVGSVATAILAQLGYQVAAVSGRPETADYLKDLGAARLIARADLAEAIKRPMESEIWAGAIDAVGGAMLARLLGQMKSGASVAAVGNAGGLQVPANIIPFLLRGINLLGINSVHVPHARRLQIWDRIARDLPFAKLDAMLEIKPLADVPRLGEEILQGRLKGRVVIDVNA